MKPDRVSSYSAAGAYPAKLFQCEGVLDDKGRIKPIHLQLCPTNRCNKSCEWCSCSERERSTEMPFNEVCSLLESFASIGTLAMTITGGGEPLMHRRINAIIEHAIACDIAVGMVTNGRLLERLECKHDPVWIRVSTGDGDKDTDALYATIRDAVRRYPVTDWSMTYVVSTTPDSKAVIQCLREAEEMGMTHVRLVTDILEVESVDLHAVREIVEEEIESPLALWQPRDGYTRGATRCLMSLLKPLIAPDGLVYPCCGVQYAIRPKPRTFDSRMNMGHWKDYVKKHREGIPFDGSICDCCYYTAYNTALTAMTQDLDHVEFV